MLSKIHALLEAYQAERNTKVLYSPDWNYLEGKCQGILAVLRIDGLEEFLAVGEGA